MRSSKTRSRSKPNRNRSVGNVVNRVFDSSGPEGKVRGTPQQIIDKYNQLARDAQLAGDRVGTENFQQHSEHYTRMLAEAQREQDARREQQEAQQRERQQQQAEARADRQDQPRQERPRQEQPRQEQPREPAPQPPRPEAPPQPAAQSDSGVDVIDMDGEGETGLVETPESKPARSRTRRPRKPSATKPASGESEQPAADKSPDSDKPGPAEAAE